jgi:hypothetical protein
MAVEKHLVAMPDQATPMRVLLVEDNAADAMVAQAAVERASFGPAVVARAQPCLGAVHRRPWRSTSCSWT